LETGEDDEHGGSLTESTDKEELPSSDLLDEEERGEGEDGVDDGKDTTEDEGQSSLKTDLLLEQDGRVVNDGVTTTELLEKLGRSTDQSSTQVLLLSTLEQVSGARLELGLSGDSIGHLGSLGNSSRVLDLDTLESGDSTGSLGVVAVLDEPSGRFGEDGDTRHHDDGEEDLESNGESP